MSERAVLLVGFGGPESLDEVPPFVESVLGRIPPEHVTTGATARYRAIGGKSPLPGTTREQAALLEEELSQRGLDLPVHVAMLHAAPRITETAARIVEDGVEELAVISLAPYRCEVSTDAYEEAAIAAFEGSGVRLLLAEDWNLQPRYVSALAEMLGAVIADAPEGAPVVFAAHSLPTRMIEAGDPSADQLHATAGAVAGQLGLDQWHLAYQSVSAAAREPWLGPSVDELINQFADAGLGAMVVDPIGFISDHVETLYDNDIEHRAIADERGLGFHRCMCLNLHPGLIGALADVAGAVFERV